MLFIFACCLHWTVNISFYAAMRLVGFLLPLDKCWFNKLYTAVDFYILNKWWVKCHICMNSLFGRCNMLSAYRTIYRTFFLLFSLICFLMVYKGLGDVNMLRRDTFLRKTSVRHKTTDQ